MGKVQYSKVAETRSLLAWEGLIIEMFCARGGAPSPMARLLVTDDSTFGGGWLGWLVQASSINQIGSPGGPLFSLRWSFASRTGRMGKNGTGAVRL